MLKIWILFFSIAPALFASYLQGKVLFRSKCNVCHAGYFPASELKKNFFDKNNTLLHLKAPTTNMLAWVVTKSPKRIVDPADAEMSREAVALYLQETLENPDSDTLFEHNIRKYFGKHPVLKGLSQKDYDDLADYLLQYDAMRKKSILEPLKHGRLGKDFRLDQLLEAAKMEHKNIIVEAMSPSCHYCVRMEKTVLKDPELKKSMEKDFLFVHLDVSESELPPALAKHYRHITPSFFFLDQNGTLLNSYPGSWKKNDFMMILNENRPRKEKRE